MVRTTIAAFALIAAGLLTGCGTSTTGPDGGSWHQTDTGVSGSSGYPAGDPRDANTPALASSTETQYSENNMKQGGVLDAGAHQDSAKEDHAKESESK